MSECQACLGLTLSLDKISEIWQEIFRMQKMCILLSKKIVKTELIHNIELQEIEALRALERHMNYAISQETSKISGFKSCTFPPKETESFFFERLNENIFWHYYQ
jgi:hypothetical protein